MKKTILSILFVAIALGVFASKVNASSEKMEFWQVAKIEFDGEKFVNTVPYGERGYVYGIEKLSPPYVVAGYVYLGSEDTQAGVTLFWYTIDPGYASPYKAANFPNWRTCSESENPYLSGMVSMEKASEGMRYTWNEADKKYDGPFHSVLPGEKGYTNPLVPGGNVSGYYPGCYVDLGSGGRYYFYHPVGQ